MTSGVLRLAEVCSLPRSRASGASVASRFCAAMRPTARMIFGLSNAIWFDRIWQAARNLGRTSDRDWPADGT